MGYSDVIHPSLFGDRVYHRSTTGYCTFVDHALVTLGRKQNIVEISSAEAQSKPMIHINYELMWNQSLREMAFIFSKLMVMHCDNQVAIYMPIILFSREDKAQ